MSSQADEPRPMRLYISSLTPVLVAEPSDLVSRLSMFAKPLTSISIHKKPACDNSFAFITMEATKGQYAALRKSLNGVKFKGALIKIEEAKSASFEERQQKTDEQTEEQSTAQAKEEQYALYKISQRHLKDMRKTEKILFHIRRSRYQFGKTEHGRMREIIRDFRKIPPTFRVKIDGKSKVLKGKKQKLWGTAKSENVKENVWEFVEEPEQKVKDGKILIGRWLNGYGDTVEVFRREVLRIDDFEKLKASLDLGEYADTLMKDVQFEVVRANFDISAVKTETEEEKQQRLERERSLSILSAMFGDTKPIE